MYVDNQTREYPTPYTVNVSINVKNGKSSYKLDHVSILDDAEIIGAFIRPQNAAGNRKDSFGKPLVSNAALACGYITLDRGGFKVLDSCPLEFFERETLQGEYVQLDIRDGIETSRSEVNFSDPSTLTDGQVLEITFIYFNQKCA